MTSELGPIKIRNFKCFSALTIESVGRLNLIAGKNNVGKTMLLDAISLFASGADPKRLFQIIDRRENPDSEGKLFLAVRNYVPLGGVSISIGSHKLEFQMPAPTMISQSGGEPPWREFRNQPNSTTHPSLFVTSDSQSFAFDLNFAGRTSAYSDTFSVDPQIRQSMSRYQSTSDLDISPTLYRKLWDEEVDGRKAEKDLIELLRLMDLEVESITLPSSGGRALPRIRLRDQDELLPITTFGDGMSRLFTLGLALVASKGGFLLVDEIENGLHHSLFPKLWKFLFEACARLDVTLFATTHSHDATVSFSKRAVMYPGGTGVLSRLEMQKKGIVAIQYSEMEGLIASEEGLEVR
jgi:hypothetical protein